MKNGALLAVILFAIFCTGIFTGTSEGVEDHNTTTSNISENISGDEIAVSIIPTNVSAERYRIVGKTFDPYLLSVERLSGESTLLLSHHINDSDTVTVKSQTLSLRTETSIEIILESTGTEMECSDLEIGDYLLITRDADTNEICQILVSRND